MMPGSWTCNRVDLAECSRDILPGVAKFTGVSRQSVNIARVLFASSGAARIAAVLFQKMALPVLWGVQNVDLHHVGDLKQRQPVRAEIEGV